MTTRPGSDQDGGRPDRSLIPAILLLLITALGFGFRLAYVLDVPFFVDEYLQVRAAERIVARGVPLLPSGNFYSHGLLLSYLVAGLVGLGARADWLMRLPVLLLSTACIPLTYWLGRRAFSRAAGLVAAAAVAMAGDAILWGGRVRMYAPLQFFALALTAVFYVWVIEEQDRPLYRRLFVVAFWCALFCHAEAMLLLPVLGIWAWLQRGWRWCLRLPNLAAFGLAGLSIVVEILLRRIGPPVQARMAPGVLEPQVRQYLGAAIDWPGVVKIVRPLFLAPERLAATLLVLAGLAWLILRLVRWRRLPAAGRQGRALAYLYALLLPVLLMLLFVVDPEWKSPRYGLMLLPHYFLVAAAVLAAVGRAILRLLPAAGQGLPAWLAPAATVVLVVAVSWPSAVRATRETVPDYEWAFAMVAGQERPGDQVITFLCPAAFWHLGRCDYLAAPTDFAGFAVQREGRWVSGWDFVPIVDSAAGLNGVLDSAQRVWFVVDEGRLAGRYDAEFLETVLARMDLVAQEREMVVFVGPR